MKRRSCLAALAATVSARPAWAGDAEALQAVIDGAHRSADSRARDAARHPLQTLQFFGLKPEHTVIELAPGGGWYTEILAPFLRERGRLYAAHYARGDAQEYRRKSRAAFEAKLAQQPRLYDRVIVGTLPSGAETFGDIAPPGGADLVLTFRNVHNWLEAGHLDASLRAFARVLKPGGVLGVEEHRAAPGTTLQQMQRSGYVTEALLIERAQAAGLMLAARSEINANPRDTKDHPHGVWSLPPTLRADNDTERSRAVGIGESDRMTHRYVKR